MKKSRRRIEHEVADYWLTHDSAEQIDWTAPRYGSSSIRPWRGNSAGDRAPASTAPAGAQGIGEGPRRPVPVPHESTPGRKGHRAPPKDGVTRPLRLKRRRPSGNIARDSERSGGRMPIEFIGMIGVRPEGADGAAVHVIGARSTPRGCATSPGHEQAGFDKVLSATRPPRRRASSSRATPPPRPSASGT